MAGDESAPRTIPLITSRPRSRPPLWRLRPRRRQWRFVDPRTRPPKGFTDLATRLRRLLWAWALWGLYAIYLTANHKWWGAFGAGMMTLVSYLIFPRGTPPKFGLDHEFSVESTEFLTTMAGATGVPYIAGNTLEVLNNGDAFYPRMLADVRAARHSITMEAYIYWAGEIGHQFAQALAERAGNGVRVMLLLDAVGSSNIGAATLKILADGGCHVAWYNALNWKTLGRFNNRTHRKSLVVDGAVAYTGGAGIADHWRGDARGPDEWRDTQVRFTGPAVMPLQSGFAHNWLVSTGELISGERYYPTVEPRGPHALQVILSSPEVGGSSIMTMYYLAIVAARKRIWIANPYFVPDSVASETLIDARQRGVDVRVMVSGIRNDNWLARRNSVRLYGRMLNAGIQVLEYNRSMLHHKVMVIDGAWVTIGTTNFDNRSFVHNEESNVCIFDREVAAQVEQDFTRDSGICTPVALEPWRHRGVLERAGELVAFLFEDQV